MPRAALVLEFAILFIVLPLAYRFSPWRLPALPVLWLVALYCLWQMRRDPALSAVSLWRPLPNVSQLFSIALIFLAIATALWLGVRLVAPDLLFSFVRSRPVLWALVMVLYPILSVYPQGIVYRAFLMHRYASLVPNGMALIVVSAASFAFLHIIFRNPLAVVLTFGGGLLFAWRYASTESLLTSSIEHALYGCWLFTIGLGQYFYHGTIRVK